MRTGRLLGIYRCIIRTKYDISCQIYCSAKAKTLEKLDPIHNLALRLCRGAYRSSPVASLYADAGEPPLSLRREMLLLQHHVKFQRLPGWPACDIVNNPRVIDVNELNGNIAGPLGIMAKRLMTELLLPQVGVRPCETMTVPAYRLEIHYFRQLTSVTKKKTNSYACKMMFLEHMNEHYTDCANIHRWVQDRWRSWVCSRVAYKHIKGQNH